MTEYAVPVGHYNHRNASAHQYPDGQYIRDECNPITYNSNVDDGRFVQIPSYSTNNTSHVMNNNVTPYPELSTKAVTHRYDEKIPKYTSEKADFNLNQQPSHQNLPNTSGSPVAIKSTTLPTFAWMNYSSEDGNIKLNVC